MGRTHSLALLVASLLVAATFVPAGTASADPRDIAKPAEVLRTANRTGHRVSVVPSPPAPLPQVSSQVLEVVDQVNAERTARSLVPLQLSSKLMDAALGHTLRQAADGQISHVDPDDGSNPGQRIARTGYEFSAWGENVAAGYRTPQEVVDGWMNSPGHCRNVLNPAFTEIGVGYVDGDPVYEQFWTLDFARPAGEARPSGTYDDSWC